jgi:putative membrane protein
MSDGEVGDASRRTWLAAERTFLAWSRNALGAFAVAIAIGGLLPRLTPRATYWPYVVAGAGYGILGMAFLIFGGMRHRALDAVLAQGRFARLTERLTLMITAYAAALGVFTTVVVLVSS